MLGQAIIKCELAATQEQAAERTKSADRAARIAMWGGPGVGGITDLRAYDRAHRVDYLGILRTRHGIGQLGNRASFGWNASSLGQDRQPANPY